MTHNSMLDIESSVVERAGRGRSRRSYQQQYYNLRVCRKPLNEMMKKGM